MSDDPQKEALALAEEALENMYEGAAAFFGGIAGARLAFDMGERETAVVMIQSAFAGLECIKDFAAIIDPLLEETAKKQSEASNG